MRTKLMALCLFLGAGAGFSGSAAAQFGCPPGERFLPTLNRCNAMGEGDRCPRGRGFDPAEKRCLGTPREDRCPPGQEFDPRESRCADAAAVARVEFLTRWA